jgi:hypothetical protein
MVMPAWSLAAEQVIEWRSSGAKEAVVAARLELQQGRSTGLLEMQVSRFTVVICLGD